MDQTTLADSFQYILLFFVLGRITKMMALAIRLDHLIKSGQVTDQAELARVGHVSRARLTQIMDLNLIAPDIQEELLFLPYINSSRQKLLKRNVRSIGVTTDWANQRLRWRQIHR